MDYKNFLVDFSSVDLTDVYSEWMWLIDVSDLSRPLGMTSFGDLFFQKDNYEVYFLDTLEGTVELFAESQEEMIAKLSVQENLDNYMMTALVTTLREKNIKLKINELYIFNVHPIIGGEAVSSNVSVVTMRVALSLIGQLHRQVR
ncbi:MAG: T6SS immunity protein Tdi1 domain-containing protein [Candidatus Saccharimonadales bacterium]